MNYLTSGGHCRIGVGEIILLILNIASTIINIVHLIVLANLHGQTRLPYKIIIYNITMADIFHAMSKIFRAACILTIDLNFSYPHIWNVIARTISLYPPTIQQWIFVCASVERYFAVCKPMRYNTNWFIKYLGIWLILTWVGLFAAELVKDYVLIYYLDAIQEFDTYFGITRAVSIILPVLISLITLVFVFQELRKMRRRSSFTCNDDSQINSFTNYLIIIFVLFSITTLPHLVLIVLRLVHSTKASRSIFAMTMHILRALFGISNTILYGWRSQEYRKLVSSLNKSALCCKRNEVGVVTIQTGSASNSNTRMMPISSIEKIEEGVTLE